MLVDESGVLACWAVAYLIGSRTSTPSDDPALLRSVDVGVALLLILGAVWPELRAYWRVKRMALFPGAWLPTSPCISLYLPTSPHISLHLPTSPYICLFPGAWLPAQLTRVPFNVEFTIHRFAEFMMLMVGETVLQLVLA